MYMTENEGKLACFIFTVLPKMKFVEDKKQEGEIARIKESSGDQKYFVGGGSDHFGPSVPYLNRFAIQFKTYQSV